MTPKQDHQTFWGEFINLYKQHECLWRIGSKDYSNRKKKKVAYALLVDKLRERDSSADRETVTKKINSIRCAFSKEYKKVLKSVKNDIGTDGIYKPSLWYYDHLLFLKDEQLPKTSINGSHESTSHPDLVLPSTDDEMGGFPQSPVSDIPPEQHHPPRRMKAPRQTGPNPNPDTILSLIEKRLRTSRQEDEFDIYGKIVATKLRKLPGNMQIYAEKLINDILFQAQIGTLNTDVLH
ncbi:uncharacterized protein LOC143021096 isoform X2 [Oratosquilla oratoria]|uniref:uncharacterized protein LOC143021096 isoform X2 n=1 Tax=Oratosquilla oratoria TaxID=337810 RepID=UPI003F761AD1